MAATNTTDLTIIEPPRISPEEITIEIDRLSKVFNERPKEDLVKLATKQRINPTGNKKVLINRCVRFDLRRCYGASAAPWTVEDQDPNRPTSPFPDFNPQEIFDKTIDDRLLTPLLNDKNANPQVPTISQESIFTFPIPSTSLNTSPLQTVINST